MTTNAQHTPGTWAVETEADVDEAEVPNVYVCHANTVCDATVVCTIGTHEKDRGELPLDGKLAIARLIAAAPDFAEAAPDAADVLEHYAEYVRGLPSAEFERHPYIPAIEEAAAKLRAAILKATGEPK